MTAVKRRRKPRTKDRQSLAATMPAIPRRIDCFEPFAESELEGCSCWGGLDLSIVSDCSALALVFPWGDAPREAADVAKRPSDSLASIDQLYRVLVRFWLPEDTAHRLRDRVPYEHWAARGYLKLTPGNEVDFQTVIDDVGELAKRFQLHELRYDRAYAATVVQEIEAEHGVPRAEFPQTIMAYTLPSKLFERAIKKRLLRHNGNDLLTWQMGHVRIKEDSNGNIKPIRPNKNDFRTIDGVQALIMALSGALDRKQASNWDGTIDYL